MLGLQLKTNAQLDAEEQERIAQAQEFEVAKQQWSDAFTDGVAKHITDKYWEFRRHRMRTGLHERMLDALRSYSGQYAAGHLAEIRKMGGSEVFARLTAIKCRGATAMLRDVYLSGDRPWSVEPTPVPSLPEDITAAVDQLVQYELEAVRRAGQPMPPEAAEQRRTMLLKQARDAARHRAEQRARRQQDEIEDKLLEGGFYDAFATFLQDLALFPIAFIQGPNVRMQRELSWENGRLRVVQQPKMVWERVSPFDMYWTPAAERIEDADIIRRVKLQRADLQALVDVPGYDKEAILAALEDYTTGYYEFYEPGDSERALLEDKESPLVNESTYLDTVSYHGYIQGTYLRQWNRGEAARKIDGFDERFDYPVEAWIVGRHTIKLHVPPNPLRRHNYYGTSFEKVAGSMTGHGLPEILSDAQSVANSAFRSLVNNMGMASGPMVAIDESRLSVSTNPDAIYPWKRWRFTSDPYGSTGVPVSFFQPNSNASELMAVFDKMQSLADEVSGIPRYLTGNQNVSGAASTASGLNMLMNNASKVLQQVAAQIDNDVLEQVLHYAYFLTMMTSDDPNEWGDAQIVAKGITMAMAKEADRQRQLEFLQITANPVDMEILGPNGRAKILRRIDDSLGIGDVVPSEEEIEAQRQLAQQALAEKAAQAQGGQAPAPGPSDSRTNRGLDNAQRTRTPAAIARQVQP